MRVKVIYFSNFEASETCSQLEFRLLSFQMSLHGSSGEFCVLLSQYPCREPRSCGREGRCLQI